MSIILDGVVISGLSLLIGAMTYVGLRFLLQSGDLPYLRALGMLAVATAACLIASDLGLFDTGSEDPDTETVSVGDIVRPDLQGTLLTEADLASWKDDLSPFGLLWPPEGEVQTERLADVLTFDDDVDGFVAGEHDSGSLRLSAVVGFEGDAVAWMQCHVMGIWSAEAERFLHACWKSASVTGADVSAGEEWLEAALDFDGKQADGVIMRSHEACPAELLLTAISQTPEWWMASFTITASQGC